MIMIPPRARADPPAQAGRLIFNHTAGAGSQRAAHLSRAHIVARSQSAGRGGAKRPKWPWAAERAEAAESRIQVCAFVEPALGKARRHNGVDTASSLVRRKLLLLSSLSAARSLARCAGRFAVAQGCGRSPPGRPTMGLGGRAHSPIAPRAINAPQTSAQHNLIKAAALGKAARRPY